MTRRIEQARAWDVVPDASAGRTEEAFWIVDLDGQPGQTVFDRTGRLHDGDVVGQELVGDQTRSRTADCLPQLFGRHVCRGNRDVIASDLELVVGSAVSGEHVTIHRHDAAFVTEPEAVLVSQATHAFSRVAEMRENILGKLIDGTGGALRSEESATRIWLAYVVAPLLHLDVHPPTAFNEDVETDGL